MTSLTFNRRSGTWEFGWMGWGGKLDPCLAKIFSGLWKLVSNICWGKRRPGAALRLGVGSVTLSLFAVIPVLFWLGLSLLLLLPLPRVFRLVGSGGGVGPEGDDHAGHVVTAGTVSGGVRGQTLLQKLQRVVETGHGKRNKNAYNIQCLS